MATLILYMVFLALYAQYCDDDEHNSEATCTTAGNMTCYWIGRCVIDSCSRMRSEEDCTPINGLPCLWYPDRNSGHGACAYVSCTDYETEATCMGSWALGDACVWKSGCWPKKVVGCEDYNHRTKTTCTTDDDGSACLWNPIANSCGYPSCSDFQHNTEGICTTVGDVTCFWNGSHCFVAGCDDMNTQETCTSVNGRTCLWNPNNNSCGYPSCSDFQHNTEETCTTVGDETCFWQISTSHCFARSCTDIKSVTECTSVSGRTCFFETDSGICSYAECNNVQHGTGATCRGFWENGVACVWEDLWETCIGQYRSPGCKDYNHRTQTTCTADDGGRACLWNPTTNSCGYAGCGDFQHNTEGTCTTFDGQTCVWDPTVNSCNYASCSDLKHSTEGTCGGVVNNRTCVWNSDGGGRCQPASCNDFQHNTEATCTGTVDGTACVWDPTSSYCSGVDCKDADDAIECRAMASVLGCIWYNHNSTCANEMGCEDLSCGWFDQEECKSQVVADCGCVWANGTCTTVSSAHNIMVSTLLIAGILAFMLF